MTEDFLHFLWRNKLFRFLELRTVDDEPVHIIFPGYHNANAGPDFLQAVVQIGSVKWAGDVEIHVRSSDWYRHKHHLDDRYKSVILHVVYSYDSPVCRMDEEVFPTLEMKNYIPDDMFQRYEGLRFSAEDVSCRSYLSELNTLLLNDVVSSLSMERMLRKQSAVIDVLEQCHYDWNEALYRQLAISFGFKTNASAFELLSKSLPYKILQKHADSELQVGALVFGQAGLLENNADDDYYESLKYEYDYLRYKYQLVPIQPFHWNLLRMRPQNFPCVRLAQFSRLIYTLPDLLNTILRQKQLPALLNFFMVEANPYWRTHYHFGKKTHQHSVTMGKTTASLLLINTVLPILFAYYRFFGQDECLESVFLMLEQLDYEDNKITRRFDDTPFPKQNAMDSQALIELYTFYCKDKKCLDCAIGEYVVKKIYQ